MDKKLEKLIKEKGKKNTDVARLLKLSKQSFYSRCRTFDKGGISFTKDEILKISDFLGVEPQIFFEL
ncbi:helix-turn-helix domain-containing protein [uncultured Ilyobacter sp.]|uniref:helix-turn-helix domain-containing protein n=1 Tax=uncultured Ilyobacter sp. TaxID=544433 RepID=UPI0029C06B79|nr:helix-turn-helix domain-containing protein [uncultured Ilyobacter sp.]